MFRPILQNHIFANLTFLLVLVLGAYAFLKMPKERDPSVNFNWVNIATKFPGASASDVERRVTEPLEEAIARISDIKFVTSNSRQDISTILVRFGDISDELFSTRLADLRREIQTKYEELPEEAEQPEVVEITTANAYPAALIIVTGVADNESLRKQARIVKEDIERLSGVERANVAGENTSEIQVLFQPKSLLAWVYRPRMSRTRSRRIFVTIRRVACKSVTKNGECVLRVR